MLYKYIVSKVTFLYYCFILLFYILFFIIYNNIKKYCASIISLENKRNFWNNLIYTIYIIYAKYMCTHTRYIRYTYITYHHVLYRKNLPHFSSCFFLYRGTFKFDSTLIVLKQSFSSTELRGSKKNRWTREEEELMTMTKWISGYCHR